MKTKLSIFLLKMLRSMLVAILIFIAFVALYAASQFALYWYEGGIHVADKFADPPLSQQLIYRGYPIAVSAVKMDEQNNIPWMSWRKKRSYWSAMRKFPTLERCLVSTEQGGFDFNRFNWKAMRTHRQVELCLFHIGNQLRDGEKLAEWMTIQGYEASGGNSEKGAGASGSWDYAQHGGSQFPLFSEMTISEYGLMALVASSWRYPAIANISIDIRNRSQVRIETSINYTYK